MSHSSALLFDPNNPYQSLVNFTCQSGQLCDKQKMEFIECVESFFAERASLDQSLPMTQAFTCRFAQFEASTLWNVAEQVKLEDRQQRLCKLLANIAKVAKIVLDSRTITQRLIVELFPKLTNSAAEAAIEALLDLVLRPGENIHQDKQKAIAKKYPLSEEEIVSIIEQLKSERVRLWLKRFAPMVPFYCLIQACDHVYKSNIVTAACFFRLCLSKLIVVEKDKHLQECLFLSDFFAHIKCCRKRLDEISQPFVCDLALELKKTHKIDYQHTSWLYITLKQEKVQTLFSYESNLREAYPLLHRFIDRMAWSFNAWQRFFAQFKQKICECFSPQNLDTSTAILKHIFETAYMIEAPLKIPPKSVHHWLYVEAMLLIQNEEIKTWLEQNAGTFMFPALYISFNRGLNRQLQVKFEVFYLIKAAKEGKLLTQSECDFLAAAILDEYDASLHIFKDLNTPKGMDRFKGRLQNLLNDKIDLRNIEKFLSHPTYAAMLKHSYLPKARECLLEVLPTLSLETQRLLTHLV